LKGVQTIQVYEGQKTSPVKRIRSWLGPLSRDSELRSATWLLRRKSDPADHTRKLSLPPTWKSVIVRSALARFGLRHSLQSRNSAADGAFHTFPAWTEPRGADAPSGQAFLEY